MGSFLSGLLGTNSAVGVNSTSAAGALQPTTATYQNQLAQQQALAAQLQGQAAGTSGPNPAQTQYLQNAQGIAQQQAQTNAQNRALNPGLAARLSGNQAANTTQQAAGGASAQQQQAQLAAQQNLGNLYSQMQGAAAQQGGLQNQASQINAGIASGNQQAAGAITGGALNGISGASVQNMLAKGGEVEKFDSGGGVGAPWTLGGSWDSPANGPQSSVGQYINSQPIQGNNPNTNQNPSMSNQGQAANQALYQGVSSAFGAAKGSSGNSGGGGGSGLLGLAALLAKGGMAKNGPVKDLRSSGGPIGGKAKVAGDSQKNDTVSALLSPKEIVIPRSITMGKEPVKNSALFVASTLRKKGRAA